MLKCGIKAGKSAEELFNLQPIQESKDEILKELKEEKKREGIQIEDDKEAEASAKPEQQQAVECSIENDDSVVAKNDPENKLPSFRKQAFSQET